MTDTNRTVGGISPTIAFITVAVLVGLAIVGAFVLLLLRPDATATFINHIIVLVGLVVSFAGTAGLVNNLGKKVERVERQTNGTLSTRDATIETMTRRIIQLEQEKAGKGNE